MDPGGEVVATLQIRDLDEAVYRRLKERAKRERRSLACQAAVALEESLRDEDDARQRREALLDEIAAEGAISSKVSIEDVVDLIRVDRER
jgi:hypothetical protein